MPDAVDEHLDVVEPAENVLRFLQGLRIRAESDARGFAGQSRARTGISERDANVVQPFLQINRAGGVQRVNERVAARRLARASTAHRHPFDGFSPPKVVPELFELAADAMELVDRATRVELGSRVGFAASAFERGGAPGRRTVPSARSSATRPSTRELADLAKLFCDTS